MENKESSLLDDDRRSERNLAILAIARTGSRRILRSRAGETFPSIKSMTSPRDFIRSKEDAAVFHRAIFIYLRRTDAVSWSKYSSRTDTRRETVRMLGKITRMGQIFRLSCLRTDSHATFVVTVPHPAPRPFMQPFRESFHRFVDRTGNISSIGHSANARSKYRSFFFFSKILRLATGQPAVAPCCYQICCLKEVYRTNISIGYLDWIDYFHARWCFIGIASGKKRVRNSRNIHL